MPKAKVNGVEVEFEVGMTACSRGIRQVHAIGSLVISAVLLTACEPQVESSETAQPSGAPAVDRDPPRAAATEPERVRVCQAATERFTDAHAPTVVSSRSLDRDTVRIEYGAGAAPGAQIVECDFSDQEVIWRTVDGASPAQFAPERAAYAIKGDQVLLSVMVGE